ncbi:MAG TPA: Ku protein [Methylomirabilota bacterium]|jgi:DNA end-binding protein Ku
MARAIWKGSISFGLVTVPVALHSATDPKAELAFRLLHKTDQSPVEYKRFCKEEDKEVPWSEIVKGYEISRGRFVVLTEEDFARARAEGTDSVTIQDFVPGASIADFHFDHPYYLAPNGKAAAKGYALLRDALARTERVGIGTIVLRQREYLAALEPVGAALVLTTMRFAHEIRSPDDLGLPAAGRGWDKREMDLALQLINTLAGEWRPEKYKDTYHDVLKQAIERKAKGKEIAAPEPERRPRVIDLMDALRASLDQGRKAPAKAGARRAAGGARRRGQRRAA